MSYQLFISEISLHGHVDLSDSGVSHENEVILFGVETVVSKAPLRIARKNIYKNIYLLANTFVMM